MQHLKSLVDFVSLDCISKADVQQGIETAQPFPDQGWIIWSQTAPDVVANPELSTFVWGELDGSDVPTGEFFYYDGSAWQDLLLIDGSKIANGSISLTKLSLVGSTAKYIIRVNSLGTALEWISIINAIDDDSLPVAKLIAPDNVNNYILTSLLGVKSFVTISNFFTNNVPDNIVKINSLVRGAADTLGLWLKTKTDGSAVEWANIDVASLAAVGYVAGDMIRRNATNTGWEAVNSYSSKEVYDSQSSTAATIDVTLTKPAGTKWKTIDIQYSACIDNVAGGGNASAAFTWRTAPVTGVALATGANAGASNQGQTFVVNNSDDAIAPTWRYVGVVDDDLVDTDVIVIRVTATVDAALQILSGNFMAKGIYA